MKSRLLLWLLWIGCFFAPLLSSCHDDAADGGGRKKKAVVNYKVAVIMPGLQMNRWQLTAQWALDLIREAQVSSDGPDTIVNLDLEWYDEDDEGGLPAFISRVDADPQFKAIIGPLRTNNAFTAATICEKHHKPLLLPMCTSTEVQRIFAESPNVFNLTQSDIGQVEVMVSMALAKRAPSISLLVHCGDVTTAESKRSYGATFREWVGFMASEAGLKVDTVITYDDDASLEKGIDGIADYYAGWNDGMREDRATLLFVPERPEELLAYDRYRAELTGISGRGSFYPHTLCSNTVVSDIVANGITRTDYEGIDIAPAATSGFVAAYQVINGPSSAPIGGEAQLFDALYMVAYALTYKPDDVSKAIVDITDCEEDYYLNWLPQSASYSFMLLEKEILTPVSGALGRWKFDSRYHASLLNTTYRHWRLAGHEFNTLQYITLGKSERTVNNEQLWTMNAKVTDDFSTDQADRNYGKKEGNYAVIVAASTGWHNYRHQADALNIYQLLKQSGYDDDHILLIMEGDIVNDTHNLYPGQVRVRPDGANLYQDVVVDYRTSKLSPIDLSNILSGTVTERTPTVLNSGSKDNVFFFWSGHGNDGVLYLDRMNMSGQLMKTTLQDMHLKGKYRKMFFMIEACYSGSVAKQCEGVPGVLMLTAANESETSLADVLDPEMNIWLSNGFTRSCCEAVIANRKISMRDLYYHVARQTVGSHATMYNYKMYGNMFTNTVEEFLP